jgi:hypothetical protein
MWHAYADRAEISTGADRQSPEQPTLGELHPKFLDVQRTVALSGDANARKQAIMDAADQLYPLIRAGEIKPQHPVDDLFDVARNHGLLTEGVGEEIGDHLRGEVGGWLAAAIKNHRNRPPTRCDAPSSLSDDVAWDEFDRRERERPAPPPKSPRPTPPSTIDAILYAVRKRGLPALREAPTQERLARCDDAALQQLTGRIARILEKQANAG